MSTILMFCLGSFAQSQYEAIKNISMGQPYNVYSVSGKSGSYVVSSQASSSPMYFFLENEDDMRRFQLKRNWGGRYKFSFDEIGHPVTLLRGGLRDLPNIKYLRATHDDDRMVIIGETIYLLKDYEGPDNYRLEYVVTKGKAKGKKKGLKAMLKEAKAELNGGSGDLQQVDHEKIINEYLKRELAIQKVEAPKWKAANKDYYVQLDKDQAEYNKQKGVANKKLATYTWVSNKSTSTIWFTTGSGSAIKVEAGGNKRLPCDLAPMYKSNFQGEKRGLLFNPAKYCGKTFVVSTW